MTGTRISDMDVATATEDAFFPIIVGGENKRIGISSLRGVNVLDFGAVADCTAVGTGTDNWQAFRDAIDSLGDEGGTVFIPEGRYRLSARLDFTTSIRFQGEKIGQNSGFINGVAYGGALFLYGSTLVFDANTAGLYFIPHTDELDHDAVDAAGDGIDSPYWEFPSSDRSIVENLNLLSSGSADNDKHGMEIRTRLEIHGCMVRGFAGDAYHIWGSTDGTYTPGGPPYGNIGKSQLDNCRAVSCKGDGFYIAGREGNVILLTGCDAIGNTGWGFNDDGFLGNTYIACHAASNTAGSYQQSGTAAGTLYAGCYSEPGTGALTDLSAAAIVIGGNLSSDSTTTMPIDSPASVFGFGRWSRAAPAFRNAPYFGDGYNFGVSGIGSGIQQKHVTGTAAPGSGAHVTGDVVWSKTPGTGWQLGFACYSAGTPGSFYKAGNLFIDASTTWDPASLNTLTGTSTTVAVTGAVVGDFAQASFGNDLAGCLMNAYVSAADTVTVQLFNTTAGTVNLSNGTLRVRVTKNV